MLQMIDPFSLPMGAVDQFNMLGQQPLMNFVNRSNGDNNFFMRTVQRSRDNDLFFTGSKKAIKSNHGKYTGQSGQVGPPSPGYRQMMEQFGIGHYQPISKAGHIHFMDEKSGKPIRTSMRGKDFSAWIRKRQKQDPKGAAAFLKRNGIVKKNGRWMASVQQDSSAMQMMIPGQMGQNPIAGNMFGGLARHSWALPTMGAIGGLGTFGIAGMLGGLIGGTVLKKVLGGKKLGAPGFNGIGNFGNPGLFGAGVGAFGGMGMNALAGIDGFGYNMRKEMRATAQAFGDQMLIGQINNPGIPIEDLIMLFMAHMGDKYEQKLRTKMEEAARAEKRATQRERERDRIRYKAGMAQAAGGVLGGIPIVGSIAMAAGQASAMGIQMKGEADIMMRDAMAGHTKSSTILMQEVQILMNKWKQINELMSNLLKTVHDMAMTPIRNLR